MRKFPHLRQEFAEIHFQSGVVLHQFIGRIQQPILARQALAMRSSAVRIEPTSA